MRTKEFLGKHQIPFISRNILADDGALDELLAGKEVSVALTEPKGCLIGRAREQKSSSTVTYSNQIARLIQKNCLECHREGQIAPFAMSDYEEVAGWGEMIAEVVREERMPPWHANPRYGHFANATRLSDEEKNLIATWVENGCHSRCRRGGQMTGKPTELRRNLPPSASNLLDSDCSVRVGVDLPTLSASAEPRLAYFHQLYERYQLRVFRLAVRMVGLQEAADVTQQVFVCIFQKFESFRGSAKFETWLYRIAVNECLQHLRVLQALCTDLCDRGLINWLMCMCLNASSKQRGCDQ